MSIASRGRSPLYIYPKLPRTGLANMLFIWARAALLSRELNTPLVAPVWFKPNRLGPLIRREKYKRYYQGDFDNSGYVTGLKRMKLLAFAGKESEATFRVDAINDSKPRIVVVSGYKDYFRTILGSNRFIWSELLKIVNYEIRRSVEMEKGDYIGVHIRRGDFVAINQAIDIEWYRKACLEIRRREGNIPIRVFTDAKDMEIRSILKMENTHLMPKAPAVQDLMLLSKSRYIVGTSMSTFSLFASYFHRAPTIWSPVSPGVRGYGLHTDNHIATDWDGTWQEDAQYF